MGGSGSYFVNMSLVGDNSQVTDLTVATGLVRSQAADILNAACAAFEVWGCKAHKFESDAVIDSPQGGLLAIIRIEMANTWNDE